MPPSGTRASVTAGAAALPGDPAVEHTSAVVTASTQASGFIAADYTGRAREREFRLRAETTEASERSEASHANGASRRSGERESVWGSPRGEAPRIIRIITTRVS